MCNIHIIADGGGTSTNWCILANGERTFFSTESYHPINWNSDFEARIKKFWQDKIDLANAKLTFFGAGCFKESVRQAAFELFTRIGFKEISISSDLHAAAIATLGTNSGWVMIAGTGSVLFEWDGKEVQCIIGGKGHETGDEGSGYYFGKLILKALKDGLLTHEQSELVQNALNEMNLTSTNEKYQVATLAKKMGAHKELFLAYHTENARAFFESHVVSHGPAEFYAVGGYIWHHQDVFVSISRGYSITMSGILNEPIALLVERMGGFNE